MNLRSEIIDLASEGYPYPTGSVYSSGKVSILPITGEVEELLANANLAKRGMLEDIFLGIVVEQGYDSNQILQCDKEAILLNLRIANYGSQTKMRVTCSNCEADYEHPLSFAFKAKNFNCASIKKGKNELIYTFSKSKRNVKFRLPTVKEYDIYKKEGWLAFAKKITISIDGVDDINYFYEHELTAVESKLFRKYFEEHTPGYINKHTFTCPQCNTDSIIQIDIDTDIFAIRPESKMNIHAEIFDLCYYSNGAFTQEGIYRMPTSLRSFYIKKLIEAKKTEADANKAAADGKGGSKIAKPPSVKK